MTNNGHVVAAYRASPNFGERRSGLVPSHLILHYTGMPDGGAAEDWLCNIRSEVSAHYVVHEEGRVVQLVPEEMRAWHAGRSCWRGIEDINSASIGIELVNPGHFFGYPDFPEAQIGALIALCKGIMRRWPIRPENVLAHSDVAPGRKIDPGEKFPWNLLHAAGIGHYVPPVPITADQEEPAAHTARQVQRMLADYGYALDQTGIFDARTRIVIEAFQRHFRPTRIDGRADRSTVETLRSLLSALA